jgi:uncharacterized protein YndB with AHSA1/START domain
MTSTTPRAEVTPLRRPPIRQATTVRSDRAHTFDVFVATIGQWWPLQPYSAGKERVREVHVEPRLSGRVFERWDDGTECDWGRLLAWEPPARLVMSWNMTPAPTEVELTFTELGPSLTRVAVEHRGWEALSDAQLGEDCARPGGYLGGAFVQGWTEVLGRLTAAAEAG